MSCLDDFLPRDTVRAPCHNYCRDCFVRLITTTCENEQQWPPKCCLNDIPDATIVQSVDPDLQRKFHQRAQEWNIPVGDRLYCNRPTCSEFIPNARVNLADNVARCSRGHATCTICRGAQHGGRDCPQDRDLMRTEALADQEGWRRCTGCHAYVEHKDACQHMTCRCGAQFCYVCGAPWRTCQCTMEQLLAIKTSAATRRSERERREADEARELAEAIRLVEEFEREERKKAELLQQEQQRLQEEQRRRELRERFRREAARRQAVEVKFAELRSRLEDLHRVQTVAIAGNHGKEGDQLRSETAEARDSLKAKHAEDRGTFAAETNARFVELECTLNEEYNVRIREERRVEEAYADQLRIYWAGCPEAEPQIETALYPLRRRMDKGFAAWTKWMQDELDRCQFRNKDEQAIQLEMMELEEVRLAASADREYAESVQRHEAELIWADGVMRERQRMLADMEVDELEDGEGADPWLAEAWIDGDDADDDFLRDCSVPGAFRNATDALADHFRSMGNVNTPGD